MRRVERAAEVLLDREGRFTYPSLLQELGMLAPRDLEAWRGGLVPFMEKVVRANLSKLARIQTAVRRLARARDLERLAARAPRGRRYSKAGHPFVEEEDGATYRTASEARADGDTVLDGSPTIGRKVLRRLVTSTNNP